MDQKRPYNDIPNGDTAPVPPVSGDTVPLPAPGEDKTAPENGAPKPEGGNPAPEPEKKPDAKKPREKAPREKRFPGISRGARTALAVGDAAVSTLGNMVRFIVRIVLSVLLVLLLGGLLFACIFAYYVKNNLTTDLNITLEDYAISLSSTVWAYDNNGQTVELAVLATDENRIWVDYDELPPYLEKAAVAIEDKRFYDHKGVDWYRTAGAFSEFAGIELGDFGLGEGRVDVWLAVVGVDGGVVVVLWVNEGVHCFGGVVLFHEVLADEEAVVANGAQAVQCCVRADATFGDSEETVGNAADEVEGNVGVHREVGEVAVVYAHEVGASRYFSDFALGVNLHQSLHSEVVCNYHHCFYFFECED